MIIIIIILLLLVIVLIIIIIIIIITAVGLRRDDETIRDAILNKDWARIPVSHTRVCGKNVRLDGLDCHKSAGRHQRQPLLRDVIWRAV